MLDRLVEEIVGLGVPGLVLVSVVGSSGFAGAAAMTTALSALGGPVGMMGGVALLGVIGSTSRAISRHGIDYVSGAVIERFLREGYSVREIRNKVDRFPISRGLKTEIRNRLASHGRA